MSENLDLDLLGLDFKYLPEKETNLATLTAQQILDKIEAFYARDPACCGDGFAESYFLKLLAAYPVSMCSYSMTETLKLLIALAYFDNEPTDQELEEEKEYSKKYGFKPPRIGVTFDELAVYFDRSKATIHEAIKQKEEEAKALIQKARLEDQLRPEARNIALRELAEEEKLKLKANTNGETKK